MPQPPTADRLRDAIDQTPGPLKDIAKGAGANYQNLRNWFTGHTKSLDLTMAEKVWTYLTGDTFTQ